MIRLPILLILLFFSINLHSKSEKVDFHAFCYHDIRSDVSGQLDDDAHAVNTKYLAQHFQWLKDNNYNVVSNEAIRKAQNGELELPPNSVSLSFDDGFESIYTDILPLLELYQFPATIGIVTSWIESGKFDEFNRPFLTWKQIKELSESPLIEVASHSHDLHKGILANPQKNTQPAAISRKYLEGKGYESKAEYRKRIHRDLKTSADLLTLHIGKEVKTIIWPYGAFSELAWEIAKDIGFENSMVLINGKNTLGSTEHIKRHLISNNPSPIEFGELFKKSKYLRSQRVMHVDLDYVYDENIVQLNKNLDILIERVNNMQVSTVYLQAFADPDGDGNASELYFPNAVLPMRADLFNRVSWQLKTRANVEVFAWLPISSFIHPNNDKNKKWSVKSLNDGKIENSNNNFKRWSIFDPEAITAIHNIYESLAEHSSFAGILFNDDGILTDAEDFHNSAITYYKSKGLEFNSNEELITSSRLNQEWIKVKTGALIEFTLSLANTLKQHQPELKTARNIFARTILQPESESWFAQNFQKFTLNYDYTAIMAMPYMEEATNPDIWLDQLIQAVKDSKVETKKVIFELQAIDWRTQSRIPTETISKQMEKLFNNGWSQFGYYPDDFINNHPEKDVVFSSFSLSEFPYKPGDK